MTAKFIPNPKRTAGGPKIEITPAYMENNLYPENKDKPLLKLREEHRQREEEFKLELEKKQRDEKLRLAREKVIQDLKNQSEEKTSMILSGNNKELIWNTPTAILEGSQSEEDLNTDFEKENEDIVVEELPTENEESQIEELDSHLPNPGQYCVIYNEEILFKNKNIKNVKNFILDLMRQDETMQLENFIVMKRLLVNFDLILSE